MGFDVKNFSGGRGVYNAQGQKIAPTIHQYGSETDSITDILADGYFDYLIDYRNVDLAVNDLILAKGKTLEGTDNIAQLDFIQITQITPTIKTTINVDVIGAALWDASANIPPLVSSIGSGDDVYIVSVGGSTTLNGNTNWLPGQFAIFTGGVWVKYPELESTAIPYIDSSENLVSDPDIIGVVDAVTHQVSVNNASADYDGQLMVTADNGVLSTTTLAKFSSTAPHRTLDLISSRGTKTIPTVLQSSDEIGTITYLGFDGTNFTIAATEKYIVDGAVSAGTVPVSQVTTIGSTEMLRIRSEGSIQTFGNFKILGTTLGSGPTITSNPAVMQAFFYPKKAAFRAGSVSSTLWNDASIGNYSASFGQETQASGDHSFVIGDTTASTAAATRSFAGGGPFTGTFADCAFAFGGSVSASAQYAVAFGHNSNASGIASFCAGEACNPSGNYSVAMGQTVTTAAINSIGFGKNININASATGAYAFNNSGSTWTVTQADSYTVNATGGVGLGTESPNSAFHTVGTHSIAFSTVTAASDDTAGKNEVIYVDSPASAVAIELLDTDKVGGRTYTFIDIAGAATAFNITVTPQTGLISNAANAKILINNGSLRVHSSGTAWYVI